MKRARGGALPDYHAFAKEVEIPAAGRVEFRNPS